MFTTQGHLETENLTQPDFWQGAADLIIEDINEFLSMTEHLA
ncbi:hypothetical protein [Paenibacillus albidus]|nr:hypothetical protein [Paenibacillus albidus]